MDFAMLDEGEFGKLAEGRRSLIGRAGDVRRDPQLGGTQVGRDDTRLFIPRGSGMGDAPQGAEDDDVPRCDHLGTCIDVSADDEMPVMLDALPGSNRLAQIQCVMKGRLGRWDFFFLFSDRKLIESGQTKLVGARARTGIARNQHRGI